MIDFSDPFGFERPSRPIPVWVLLAGSGLLLIAIVVTTFSSRTGLGRVPVDDIAAEQVVAQELAISFVTTAEDEIRILGGPGNHVLTMLAPGEGGFLRGIVRPLTRERVRFDVPLEEPYLLQRIGPGSLVLRDPATDLLVDIAAFGPTSIEQFQQLFAAAEVSR